MGLFRLGERSFQFLVKLGFAQIALDIRHRVGKPAPSLFVNAAAVEFRGFPSIALQLFMKMIAPAFGGLFGSGHADQREVLREQMRARQVVERWNQEARGQVPAGAKNHHRTRPWRHGVSALGTLDQLDYGCHRSH